MSDKPVKLDMCLGIPDFHGDTEPISQHCSECERLAQRISLLDFDLQIETEARLAQVDKLAGLELENKRMREALNNIVKMESYTDRWGGHVTETGKFALQALIRKGG